MVNAICSVAIREHVLNPVEAEIWFTVVPNQITGGTEVRGRLVGPRCPGRATVEVAYLLQSWPAQPRTAGEITMRVVIPDPVFWTEDNPMQYEGQIELWEHGQRCASHPVILRLASRGASAASPAGDAINPQSPPTPAPVCRYPPPY